jgi:hypothetical protein
MVQNLVWFHGSTVHKCVGETPTEAGEELEQRREAQLAVLPALPPASWT